MSEAAPREVWSLIIATARCVENAVLGHLADQGVSFQESQILSLLSSEGRLSEADLMTRLDLQPAR